ncbi:MAG: hypothetical protein Q4F31_09300 [Eubacteriales bacterium]|nr:hypothetical protein [Eubacteriales bacterium]
MNDTKAKLTLNQKKALGAFSRWLNSSAYSLYDVYGSFSSGKAAAWRHCVNLFRELNGNALKVITHNTNIFTAGFEYSDPDTGAAMFYYITPSFEAAVEQPAQ